jgi:L-rhamnose mutarotase
MITRTVLAVDLKADPAAIESYRQHHRDVWPEVVASLRQSGIRQMDIYLLGRRLVMILETDGPDFRRCFAAHVASSPRVAEWEAMMRSMQAAPPDAAPGDWWTPMEHVFSLERAADTQSAPQPARRG